MKIGIDIRAVGKQRTGDEIYTRELVKNLLKIDSKNQYFLYTNTEDKSELNEISKKLEISDKKNAEIVPILPASKALWTFWSLPQYLKKNPVDVLHVQYITPQILPKGIKLVTTIHDISFNFFPQYIKKSDLIFLKTLIPLSLKRADKIIGVSDFTSKEVIGYYKIDPAKVITVNNGAGDATFEKTASENEREKIRKKYKLPDKFILYLGTLQPRKNIPALIEAYAEMKKKHHADKKIDSLHLVVVGKRSGHNYDQNISSVIENIKNDSPHIFEQIHFPGFVDDADKAGIFQMAEVFCFPSLYEGFGIPLLEAMAARVPVICSDSSCLPDIAGKAALIFVRNNKDEFVKKLYEISTKNQLRQTLMLQGEKQKDKFSWHKCANETLAVYNSFF